MSMNDEQITDDFWNEKLVLLQRQNSRLSSPLKNLNQAILELTRLQNIFPDIKQQSSITENYISIELFVSSDFHIRLYIQNQTKISFYNKTAIGFEKLCDCKLFNSPFESIIHFINHFDEYKLQLFYLLKENQKIKAQQKLCGEFVKSVLLKKLIDKKNIIWTLEYGQKDLELIIKKNNKTSKYILGINTFMQDLATVDLN